MEQEMQDKRAMVKNVNKKEGLGRRVDLALPVQLVL